jgi:hypothetical protein
LAVKNNDFLPPVNSRRITQLWTHISLLNLVLW